MEAKLHALCTPSNSAILLLVQHASALQQLNIQVASGGASWKPSTHAITIDDELVKRDWFASEHF